MLEKGRGGGKDNDGKVRRQGGKLIRVTIGNGWREAEFRRNGVKELKGMQEVRN